MIELYTLSNLLIPYANIPIITGNISAERNGYYKLTFSILSRYIKEKQIVITPNTIFKVDGFFYVCTDTGNNDGTKVELTFNAELIQTQILMFTLIEDLTYDNATALEVLDRLLEDTILEVGECDDFGAFEFKVEKNNAQYALSQLLEKTGGEISYEGLKVNIKASIWQGDSKTLIKGRDFTTLSESTDISNVITRIHYKSTSGDMSGIVDSINIDKYPIIRSGHKEFDTEDATLLSELANGYLSTVDIPACSISISIPKIRRMSLELCETVKIHNTLLNENITYKVVGYSKSLNGGEDTYQLGERKKDFTDIENMINEQAEEVVQEVVQNVIVEVIEQEVISANTAHILNAWIRDLNVEYLETNFEALDVRKPYPEEGIRNFIRIKDERIDFVTQTLSDTETQDYLNKDGDQIYYTAIDDHIQAYKFFTITSPSNIYQDLTDDQVDKFKVKVRKIVSESIKASFDFGVIGDTQYPLMRWGRGTDVDGATDKGQGFIYKDLDGLVFKYVTSSGTIHQIKLGEKGIEGIPLGGETIIQNINMGGLIEIPGQALTKASFSDKSITVEHGEITTTFNWTKDAQGRIKELYNSQTGLTVPISWE